MKEKETNKEMGNMPGIGSKKFTVPFKKEWFPTEKNLKDGQSLADWMKRQDAITAHANKIHAKTDRQMKKKRIRYHKLRLFQDGLKRTWNNLLCKVFGHELNYDHENLWCPRCNMALEEIYAMNGLDFYVAMNKIYRLDAVNSSAQYVDYAIALKLKLMGFTEICDAWYRPQDRKLYYNQSGFADNSSEQRIAAPTIQVAFTWLDMVNKNMRYIPTPLHDGIFCKCGNCGANYEPRRDTPNFGIKFSCAYCGSDKTITYEIKIIDNYQPLR